MHIHLGVAHLVAAFMGIIFIGAIWRAIAFVLAASDDAMLEDVGQAMAFVY